MMHSRSHVLSAHIATTLRKWFVACGPQCWMQRDATLICANFQVHSTYKYGFAQPNDFFVLRIE